jgi:hypothetical protein
MTRSPATSAMICRTVGAAALILLLLGSTRRGEAQELGFLTGLFKDLTDINSFAIAWGKPIGGSDLKANGQLSGFGVEAAFVVDTVGCRRNCPVGGDGNDDPRNPVYNWVFTAALGYSRISGFTSTLPDVRYFGAIEELPSIAAYAIHNLDEDLSVYGGLRTGLTRLSGFRGFVTDSTFHAGSGTTYLFGVSFGLSADLIEATSLANSSLQFFAEWAYTYRRFPSLEWSGKPNTNVVPTILPRTLRASTMHLSFGVELEL